MDYDAIVIGGGHAGIEAALAVSRLNFSTLFITQNADTIGNYHVIRQSEVFRKEIL